MLFLSMNWESGDMSQGACGVYFLGNNLTKILVKLRIHKWIRPVSMFNEPREKINMQ